MSKSTLSDIRREYGLQSLDEKNVLNDPIQQFQHWFDEVVNTHKEDPTAMVLATVDSRNIPDTRVVLLKEIIDGCFIFYTNYQSTKGQQTENNSFVALNFYWPVLCRQVRVRGIISKVTHETSDQYFVTRPRASQISAIASPQSKVISNRGVLEKQVEQVTTEMMDQTIARPAHWGGYQVNPFEMEFWQGRDNRMHDRLQYVLEDKKWRIFRLAP